MREKKIIICGLGNVGRQFAHLVVDKNADIKKRFGLELKVVAIAELGGSLYDDGKALDVSAILKHVEAKNPPSSLANLWREKVSGPELIRTVEADMIVETTPTNLKDGEPATSHMYAAIEKGFDIVSANKGPLVLYYSDLNEKAKKSGTRLFISAATAAALPTLDVGILSTAGSQVLSFEGILNGTTNFILTKMRLEGSSYASALAEAQKLGIAETDPTLDVEGFDTSNKCVLIANRVFGVNASLTDVNRKGITEVTPEEIDIATKEGKVIKLIGKGVMENGKIKLTVQPEKLDANHPLASINFSEKAVSYDTDTMGMLTISGGKSSPIGAAAALLKDVIHTALLQ